MARATTMAEDSDEHSWWRRPAGGVEVLRVALPLVVSTLSWTVMTFIDRAFLSSVSSELMAVAFTGSVVWFALVCLPLGICSYVSTFVSQYHGDAQLTRIGPVVWQGVWAALGFSIPVLLAIPLAHAILPVGEHSLEAHVGKVVYFQILCVAGPGMLLAAALSSFYNGREQTWVVMIVDTVGMIVNVALDYLWIFGHGGFPAMGIAGAAWATVVAFWLKVVIFLVLILQKKHRQEFHTLAGLRFDGELFRRLMRFGGPSGVQMLLDVLGFTTFIVLVERIGPLESAATAMTFNIATLAFMPIWGFGMAASILVGQHLGENRDDLAARATYTTLQFSYVYIGVISLFYYFTPDLFLDPFLRNKTAPPGELETLRALGTQLLRIVAIYNLMDATFMVFVSAVKGAGDTRFVMTASLVMSCVLAGLSYLTIEVWHLSLIACWWAVTCWVFSMGAIFALRFLDGKWRAMRVIVMRVETVETGQV